MKCEESGHTTGEYFKDNSVGAYFGIIDENIEPIGMTLAYSGPNVEGRFFYKDKYTDKSDEMKVSGCLEKGRDFVLYVYKDDSVLAVIHGQFPETDPKGGYNGSKLDREIIIGIWEDNLTSENSSIYLRLEYGVSTLDNQYEVAGAQDDQLIDKAAQELLGAVASEDKESVAQMIEYPIWADIDGERKQVMNQDEFLINYDKIFTDEFKAILAGTRPHHMFANWEGIMLGRGDIWFNSNGKVVAINNGGG